MELFCNDFGTYAVLQKSGSLSLDNLKEFEDLLNQNLGIPKNVIVDLTETLFIDSSVLGLIILFFSKFERNNKNLILANPNDKISQMLDFTGASRRIKIFKSVDESVKYIQGNK